MSFLVAYNLRSVRGLSCYTIERYDAALWPSEINRNFDSIKLKKTQFTCFNFHAELVLFSGRGSFEWQNPNSTIIVSRLAFTPIQADGWNFSLSHFCFIFWFPKRMTRAQNPKFFDLTEMVCFRPAGDEPTPSQLNLLVVGLTLFSLHSCRIKL